MIQIEPSWFQSVNVNLRAIEEAATYYSTSYKVKGLNELVWALKALTLTDLTTLAGDDTQSNVQRLCLRAAYPFTDAELSVLDADVRETIHTAAVCVYPSRVADAAKYLSEINRNIEIAAGKNQ